MDEDEFRQWVEADAAGRAYLERRQDREYRLVREDFYKNMAGLGTAFVITMAFLFVSAFLIVQGYGVYGTILGSVDLVALVTIFVTSGSRPQPPAPLPSPDEPRELGPPES